MPDPRDRHAFDPVTFHNRDGSVDCDTDWCGHWPDYTDLASFCGRLADDPVHAAAAPSAAERVYGQFVAEVARNLVALGASPAPDRALAEAAIEAVRRTTNRTARTRAQETGPPWRRRSIRRTPPTGEDG